MEDTGSTATKEKKGCCKIDNVWLFEKIAGDFDDIDSQAWAFESKPTHLDQANKSCL